MFLKICGITRLGDAQHALEQGATALGFVFWPHSSRFVTSDRAAAIIAELPSGIATVGVFVNQPVDVIQTVVAATGISMVQLHGDEPPAVASELGVPLLRSETLDDVDEARGTWSSDTILLLDAADVTQRGGTGKPVDWVRAAGVARRGRIVLAGGLTPENVAGAIGLVRPFGVDVSSGVEESPGLKDGDKVTRFLANARRAFGDSSRIAVE